MSSYDHYSISGCLIDENHNAPKLQSMGGTDPLGTMGAAGDPLPPVVDLRQWCSPVEDQRQTQSCVANAVVGGLELLQRKENHSSHDLSRMFVYYNSRKLHDYENRDDGTFVNTCVAAIMAYGICEERLWPFSEVNVNVKPIQACFDNAENYRAIEYAEVEKGTPLTHVLASGLPLVMAVKLPREAYDIANQTGTMQLPEGGGTSHNHGNHSMLVVGYDLGTKCYLVRNSWGAGWAQGGYFWMPMQIFHDVNFARQTWVMGSLGSRAGLRLLGKSVPAAAAGMEAAMKNVPPPLAQDAGKAIRDEIQGGVDKAREGFANRLRGN